jgi:hypothetical protein
MRMFKLPRVWVFLILTCLTASAAWAATATQLFIVNVPVRVIIKAPPLDQIKGHPGNGGVDVTFAPQTWWAAGNSTRGVNVILETVTAFRHTTTPSSRRNARLDLTATKIKGRGTWTVNTATATTDHRNGNENARVRASSNGTGEANLFLTVTFITNGSGGLQEGDYTMTVLGTVTEN